MSSDSTNQMVQLSIDDKEVLVPKGTTILEACNNLNIDIPTLCHLKQLAPDGSCRMCVVEVDNGRKNSLQPSCAALCEDNITVQTHSEKVVTARRFILDLLLSNHVLTCFTCASNGECKLQDYSLEYGVEQTSFLTGKRIGMNHVDSSNPFFTFHPEKCIMCRRCTRVCEKLQGRDVISVTGKGFDVQMSPSYNLPFDKSTCESCGNCVSNCPTGALASKDEQKHYRAYEVTKVRTTCPHCGTGCQMDLLVKNNKVVGVNPADGAANKNLLCVKGKFGSYKFIHSGERLTHPLIKRNGTFEQASWDEALDLIASKFTALKNEYGPDVNAGFSCSRAPNEDNYIFQKMIRAAFGTNNVDNCARVCHSASVHGLAQTLGSGAMTNPIQDITQDVDVILLVGSNTTEAHPVVGAQIRQAIQKGTKIIVVDPRKIDLTENATIHLPIKAGTNVAFANAMIHVILEEGLEDKEFIKNRTEGFDELAEIVKTYTPEKVAKICHVQAEDIRKAARMYANAKKAPIIYCLGVTEHSTGTQGVMSLSNLAMVVGKLGKSGCGINPLRGQNNVQGACDMGCMPYDFPGYQKVANDSVREKFEKAWQVPLSNTVGLTSTQVLPGAIRGEMKGLYIFGEDPIVTDPDTNHVIKALTNLEFLVVQDLFMTETAQYADVVLPGTSYAEKEGTFSNTERRVQRVRKAVQLDGEMRLDSDIFYDVMNRMGHPYKTKSASEIMDEIASLTPSFGGISFKRLDNGESLQWPCPTPESKGTPILHVGKFTRGLGYFYPSVYIPSKELPDDDYPFLLVTGRMLYHYNTGAMTHKTEGLDEICSDSYIEINEEDASKMGIKQGEKVKVRSRRGEIETTARVGVRVLPSEVFMTFHFQDGNVNWVTNAVTDDIAHIPEYKVCAVSVQPA